MLRRKPTKSAFDNLYFFCYNAVMDFKIIKMTADDKDAVMEMMRTFYASDAVSTNGSDEIFSNDVDACVGSSPYAEGYVFKDGENYLGYGMLAKSYSTEFGKNCIWIEDLYIVPSARSKGIGRAFFAFVREKYRGCALRLEVEKENVRAIALYEKCGYETLPYSEMINLK